MEDVYVGKKLELRGVTPCTLPMPKVPENIKADCEWYISLWNQLVYEENTDNYLKMNNTKDDDSIESVNENIEYFVTEEEAETFENFDLSPLKGSPIKDSSNTIGIVISIIEEEQLEFGDKLNKYIECSIAF